MISFAKKWTFSYLFLLEEAKNNIGIVSAPCRSFISFSEFLGMVAVPKFNAIFPNMYLLCSIHNSE